MLKFLSVVISILIFNTSLFAGAKEDSEIIKVAFFELKNFQEGASDALPKSGYANDFLHRISNVTGWKYEYVYGDWQYLYKQFLKGKIDIFMGLTKSKSRLKNMDFSTHYLATEQYYIFLKKEDKTEDLKSLHNKRIGVIQGTNIASSLEKFLKKNNIRAALVYKKTWEELKGSLENGTVNAFAGSDKFIDGVKNMEPVFLYDFAETYIAIRKGAGNVLKILDSAIASVEAEDPKFRTKLNEKYSTKAKESDLTESQKAFLAKHGNLKIGFVNKYLPFSAIDESGNVSGILIHIVELLKKQLKQDSLNMEWHPYETYDSLEKALKEEQIDIAFPVVNNPWHSENSELAESVVLVSSSVDLIYSGAYSDSTVSKIAVSKHSPLQKIYASYKYPNSTFIWTNSAEENLNAVLNGKANSTIFNSARTEIYLSKRKFEKLRVMHLAEGVDYSFAVKKGNVQLLGILNKGLASVHLPYLQNLMYRYTESNHSYSLYEFVRENFLIVLVLTILLTLFFSFSVFIYFDEKRKKKYIQEAHEAEVQKLNQEIFKGNVLSEERYRVINSISKIYYVTYYVDLKNETYKELASTKEVRQALENILNIRDALAIMCEQLLEPEFIKSMAEFTNLDTLNARLKDKNIITQQYKGVFSGWSEAYIITVDRDESGNLNHFLLAVRLIQEEKEKEIRLQKESLFQRNCADVLSREYPSVMLLNAKEQKVSMIKYNGKMLSQNKEASMHSYYRMWHWYAGHTVFEDDRKALLSFIELENILKILKTEPECSFRYRIEKKGKCEFLQVTFFNMFSEKGIFIFGFRNITQIIEEEIKEHQKLEQALLKAEESSKSKSSFLFNMSHDIRTPLNAILGYTKLLQRNNIHKDIRQKYTDNILMMGNYLLHLVSDILEMARLENAKAVLNESPKDISKICQDVISVARYEAEQKNIQLICDSEIQSHYVFMDETKIKQILLNILGNAIKYTPEGKRVSVHFTEEESETSGVTDFVSVIEDTGIGISKEFLPHVFDLFVRERSAVETKIEGTGLGLSIVRRLVDLMHGIIRIDSEQNKGTKVYIRIPFRKTEAPEQKKQKIEMNETFKGKRILLTEDNDLNAEIAETFLKDFGFFVERAENGFVCINKLKESSAGYYDLILMDIQMPEMNGFEATKQIRQMANVLKANIPIIAMTANALEEDRQNAFDAGMNGHIAKPIDIKQLKEVLSSVL